MNKSELVAIMAEKASLSKKDAEGALNAFVDAVKDAVKKNDKVQLVGFGTFESRKREAREGKNPQTGEKIKNIVPSSSIQPFVLDSSIRSRSRA